MIMTIDQQHSLFNPSPSTPLLEDSFFPTLSNFLFSNSVIRSTQCYFPCLKSRIMLKKAMYSRCSTSPSAMLQLIRNAQTKLFVGVRVICDHVLGKSKGYGFVKFASEDSAASALKEMND
ncbi:glycine-rich RNA-binding protein 4, mitochondrial-like isoform X2 [Amaranthus tricolor]|uniref:glycine-rich RNA-binding protein 4, mitochondrial-like isoform X2 n=1 Tax=Amaranthus tricolor TaxID=29722 RepID=UPI002584FE9C|nr:glycine-rich RNA-binding protein 4, mitochondrial-like isoform X2 [Amaranthus tricolor]